MAAGAVEVNVTTNNFKPCAVFDGVDDYVEVAHNANQLGANLTNGFTISAWVNPKTIGETSGKILHKGTGAEGDDGFTYGLYTSNRILVKINAGSDVRCAVNGVPYNLWTHVLVTVSSASLASHYINGVLNGTPGTMDELISTIIDTNAMTIGNRTGAQDRTFDGGISQVKMWNRVLTTAEITADYQGTPISDGLILDVPFDGSYTDNAGNAVTNSGSILSIRDDTIAAAIKADRTTANDKYLMVGMPGGQVVSAVIEEDP